MHIAQFLDTLSFGPDIEIVESLLLDMLRRELKKTPQLLWVEGERSGPPAISSNFLNVRTSQ